MSTNAIVHLSRGEFSGRENVTRALKRLKAKLDKEGTLDIVRFKRCHETAAQVKKRKAKKLSRTWKFIKTQSKFSL